MSQRIYLELLESTEKSKKWSDIKQYIVSVGGTHISEPTGDPPYIITAIVGEEIVDEVLDHLKNVFQVRADRDRIRRALLF